MGRRVLAQAAVPGILRKQQLYEEQRVAFLERKRIAEEKGEEFTEEELSFSSSLLEYGSADAGKSISSNPEFHELAKEMAKHLYADEHTVVDEKGVEHSLWTSLDVKV